MEALSNSLASFWRTLTNIISTFTPKDIIDVLVVTLLIYSLIKLVRETRAGQLLKGLLLLAIIYILASYFNLLMLTAILSEVVKFAVVALVVLFQPEIRKALEQMGRNNVGKSIAGFFSDSQLTIENEVMISAIESVVETSAMLQQMRMGALIVFERKTKLNEVVSTGTMIEADATAPLMGNIFYNKAPLHDGAMIIRDGRILAAGCILPLTARSNVNSALGTRHRAALGISEDTDALAIVVSEETGQISISQNGVLTRNYNRLTLKETLIDLLIIKSDASIKDVLSKKLGFNSRKGGSKDE